MKRLMSILFTATLLSSCLKEELPIQKPQPGDVETAQVSMSADYTYQVFFDLNSGEEVSKNFKTDWDLGFECSDNGSHIILNSSKLMFAADTKDSDPTLSDTSGNYSWKSDVASGNLDSSALINWQSGNLFIINRGYNSKGKHQGFYKLIVHSFDNESFEISFAELSEDKLQSVTINKNNALNFVQFSFEDGGKLVPIEPDKSTWDLCFTQYTESLFDGELYIPYLVTGVITNRNQTLCAFIDNLPFDQINYEKALELDLSDKINVIGYGWKEYDFDLGLYAIDSDKVYIVRNRSGIYYKLRFIDFYDNSGERGSPLFEYQRL